MIPVKEFHLVHATDVFNLEEILASGSLLSISKTGPESSEFYELYVGDDEDVNKYGKKIFTGLIMPDENGKPNFTYNKVNSVKFGLPYVYFILKPQLIRDYAECSFKETADIEVSFPHFCHRWSVGKNKDCIKYDTTKSLKDNLNSWRKAHIEYIKFIKEKDKKGEKENPGNYVNSFVPFSIYFTPYNEVTIQFSKNSKGECIESEIPLDKYLQAIYIRENKNNNGKIKELARKYPQYNWIFG
jgi:hypothetical protein